MVEGGEARGMSGSEGRFKRVNGGLDATVTRWWGADGVPRTGSNLQRHRYMGQSLSPVS